MKAKKEDKCLRTVSRHFLGGSFFVGTLVKKKFDCQNFMEERERACGRVFEILMSVVELSCSRFLPIIKYFTTFTTTFTTTTTREPLPSRFL